ncbi:MAG: permease [Actinomycetota bacterium]|nr:permease [Actinomycetota bacterium]
MSTAWHALLHALRLAGSMTWQVTWSLILGFTLSAIIEALVRKSTIVRLLPDDRPRSLATAAGLGAASSSCSYAAVALARSLYRKGADFTAAMAFQFASTNLVIELGLILALLIGWRFTLAEFVGGPLMIVFLGLLFRRFLTTRLREAAAAQSAKGIAGSMEGHAAMDMSVQGDGSFSRRLASPAGFTSVSHNFVMEWAAILRDLVLGLLIAGAAAAWIPNSFWQHLFFSGNPLLAKLWGPLIGPLVAVATFVCSIGNVPLAAVLWNGGISFGGVVAFIFADLIIIPILLIYRKYYGARMAWFLFATFYATMAAAGYVIEFVFSPLGLAPSGARHANVGADGIRWNYTSVLNIIFLLLAATLLYRFFTTGGRQMLAMMGGGPDDMSYHAHDDAHDHHDGDAQHAKATGAPQHPDGIETRPDHGHQ